VGVDFNFDVPEEVARREIENAIFLWERKGTRDNTVDWIEFITGFRVRIREFYKEVLRTNVWGQAYRGTVVTNSPTIWRESWDTLLTVPSSSRSRVLPPTVWEEEWERVIRGDPYATLPHLNEHHATNTWNGTNALRPFYNFSIEDDVNYGTHGFTQTRHRSPDDGETLNGFLFRNHTGIYIDIHDIDIVDTIDTFNETMPLTTENRINDIFISTGLRVIFTNLTEINDNDIVWEATVDLDGNVTWALHIITPEEIGIDFEWFGTPFLDIILTKVARILDLITFYGVVNHLFWRLVSIEDAYLCHQYRYSVVPHIMEGWGKNIGDDLEIIPEVFTVTQTTNCEAVEEETFACYGDTYNIDIGNAYCCAEDDTACESQGRLATYVLCTNNSDETTNSDESPGPWLTFYAAKYWSHQVDDVLQEWVPDTDGDLYLEITIPAEYSLAELFINSLIGTGTGQGVENPTTIADYIYETCFTGVFDVVIIEEEWDNPFTETEIFSDNWNYAVTFDEYPIFTDDWNLPAFGEDLIFTDNWEYNISPDEYPIFVDDWENNEAFDETFIIYDDWEDDLPMLISDDEIWLDGNNGPMANSPVGFWRDRSGSNNDATQDTGGNQPDFTQHDPNYNNFGTVTFDGIDDYMVIADNVLLNTDRFSLYMVGHWTNPSDYASFVSKAVDETGMTGGWGLLQFPDSLGHTLRFFVDDITSHYIDYTLADDTPIIVKCTYDQSELKMSVNRVSITSAFSLYGGGTINSSDELYVGAFAESGIIGVNGPLHGTIAEFIYYSRILTDSEDLLLWLYLSTKYNIPVTEEVLLVYESWEASLMLVDYLDPLMTIFGRFRPV
jgi:hypothetical protein